MITLILIFVACFLTGLITLITGFGLGTLLAPIFTLIYNVKIALFLVALIHLTNNCFKFFLFHKAIDLKVFKRFGLISLVGAMAGASLFGLFSTLWLKKVYGAFLIWSGTSELLSRDQRKPIPRKWELGGGFMSGFLGGLIGAQGAIRAAYLLNYPLSKEAFIATGTAISILVDLARIPIYLFSEKVMFFQLNPYLVLGVIIAALAGTRIGKHLLHNLSLNLFRKIISITLIILGIYFFF